MAVSALSGGEPCRRRVSYAERNHSSFIVRNGGDWGYDLDPSPVGRFPNQHDHG
jgi:hypothetical protein